MRYIIWILRSAFCKHEWERAERNYEQAETLFRIKYNPVKVSATCTKCGWHRSYWKW